jgi:hypothetical protein
MSAVNRLTSKKSKGGLVALASTTSIDTLFAKRLILVTFDLPNSIVDSAQSL